MILAVDHSDMRNANGEAARVVHTDATNSPRVAACRCRFTGPSDMHADPAPRLRLANRPGHPLIAIVRRSRTAAGV